MISQIDNYILSFYPPWIQQQIRYTRSAIVGLLFIALGRLLPTIVVPDIDLTDKTAIVTGANSGIGLQIASDLAQRGATVYLACRTRSKAEEAIQVITTKFPQAKGRTFFAELDTSSLDSVRSFASSWSTNKNNVGKEIDILVHNAGIAGPPDSQQFISGLEITYTTNFLGSFLLTYLLQKHFSRTVRIILTSSTAQYSSKITATFAEKSQPNIIEPGFHSHPRKNETNLKPKGFELYSNTKAMQGAFARILQQKLNKDPNNMKVTHYFTPDLTSTPILGKMKESVFEDPAKWLLRKLNILAISVEHGAATGLYLAVAHDPEIIDPRRGGRYWDQMYCLTAGPDLMSQDMLDRLWNRWENDAGIRW